MSGERSGIGREDNAILKKKKKDCKHDGKSSEIKQTILMLLVHKLLIKLYCYPYEREKSIGISELILQLLLYLRIQ